jgi:hypothetical protein
MNGSGTRCALWAGGISFVVVLALGSALPRQGQNRLTPAEAREDLRYLFSTLEETHPDPYSAFGGRVNFKSRLATVLEAVPEAGLTSMEIYDIVRPLFGELRDGHTYVNSPPGASSSGPASRLPVRFGVAMDGIFVESAVPPYDALIGYRLHSVQGASTERAAELAAAVFPAENRFGASGWLLRFLGTDRGARRVFPEVEDSLVVELAGPDSERVETHLPYPRLAGANSDSGWVVNRWDSITDGPGPFHWQILDDMNVGYLRVSSIQGREAFEELKAVGRRDLQEQMARYYERFESEAMPAALDVALDGVPCFTEAVRGLLTAMRERKSEHLILDLRGNGGGWSSLITPFLVLVFGDRYLAYDYPVRFATRISQSYLELRGRTLSQLNAELGTDYELGDYLIAEEESITSQMSRDEYAQELGSYACGLADLVRGQDGAPIHSPKVLVLVDPSTFSAAYHFAYRVWHLGAKIVGVPSSQAGNAFVDVTPFELPHSRLSGSISRTSQILFPGEEGRVMIPDFPMTWRDFAAYDFDEHAEVRFALDLIRRIY